MHKTDYGNNEIARYNNYNTHFLFNRSHLWNYYSTGLCSYRSGAALLE